MHVRNIATSLVPGWLCLVGSGVFGCTHPREARTTFETPASLAPPQSNDDCASAEQARTDAARYRSAGRLVRAETLLAAAARQCVAESETLDVLRVEILIERGRLTTAKEQMARLSKERQSALAPLLAKARSDFSRTDPTELVEDSFKAEKNGHPEHAHRLLEQAAGVAEDRSGERPMTVLPEAIVNNFGHPSVAWSRDGTRLVVSDARHASTYWVAEAREISRRDLNVRALSHDARMALTHRGKVVELKTGNEVSSFDLGNEPVSFSHDGARLAYFEYTHGVTMVEVVDLSTGNKISVGPTVTDTAIEISPHGRFLALGSKLGEIEIWDLERRARVLQTNMWSQGETTGLDATGLIRRAISGFAFFPDEKRLAVAYLQGVRVMDLPSGKISTRFENASAWGERPARGVQVIPGEEKLLVTGSQTEMSELETEYWFALYDLKGQRRVTQLAPTATRGALSPDGRKVAFVGTSGVSLFELSTQRLTPMGAPTQSAKIVDIGFSSDGGSLRAFGETEKWDWPITRDDLPTKASKQSFDARIAALGLRRGDDHRSVLDGDRVLAECLDSRIENIAISPNRNVVAAFCTTLGDRPTQSVELFSLVHRGQHLATLRAPVTGGPPIAILRSGQVEVFGSSAPWLSCRIGGDVLPFDACTDQLLLPQNTLAQMLATGELWNHSSGSR